VQTLAAYVIFLLVIMGIGVAIIFGAIFSLVAFAGIAWMKSRPGFRTCQRSISEGLARIAARIGNQLHVVQRVLRAPLFHTHR
jgi:ABC-type antimicrobial peptide transport system permease subunit